MTSTTPLGLSTWFALLAYQVSVFALSYRISSSFLSTTTRRRRLSIDELPDSILISIFDRLPVKDAIRTCVLSRRWANLYKSVIHLDLRCHHLVCRPYSRTWIRVMLQRLDLDDYPEPIGFFRCLKIAGIAPKYFRSRKWLENQQPHLLLLPVQDVLRTLRAIRLRPLGIRNSSSNAAASIIRTRAVARFPAATTFPRLAASPTWSSNPQLLTPTPQVGPFRFLAESSPAGGGLPRVPPVRCAPSYSTLRFCGAHIRLECLVIEMCAGVKEMRFHAASLVSIEFHNRKPVVFVFHHVPRLQTLHVITCDIDMIRVHLDDPTNTFSNLRRLRLRLDRTAYKYMIVRMIPFLKMCPVLHEFRLDTEIVYNDGPMMKMLSSDTLIHTELKKVEINGFCGTKNKIEFASCILENATSLEQMQISRCPRCDIGGNQHWWMHKSEWSQETCEKILKLVNGQKVSKSARVIIQHVPSYDDDTLADRL
ncbi:FBD-associated F-box protein [Striga asiatica]|uniref:FBD-associated F-box protein n=1 Tax=Striga asiatica TaxID=4170 RepID=A0A5A7PYR5_STRAF|nr:FBD-associated F-box protein [Striga asiatica]